MRLFILGLMGLIILNSCDSNRVYEDNLDFNNAYWLADSIKSFDFDIEDAGSSYNIMLNLRNGIEYPHRNIYIHYAISDSTKTILDEELRNFQLFHPKSGYPYGSGSSNIRQHQFNLLMDYRFPHQGRYHISFEQYMRYDSLPEVYSVGVRIERPKR